MNVPATMIITMLTWLVRLCYVIKPIRQLYQNIIIRVAFMVCFAAWILKFTGMTSTNIVFG